MDSTDLSILSHLQCNGRLSNADLARAVKLSPPAVHARVKRLEEEGVIEGYAALLNLEKVGFDFISFVQIGLTGHQEEQVKTVHAEIHKLPEVLECHHVTGDFDFLLKVVIRNRHGLHRFIVDQLVTIPGISRVNTSVVLKQVKSTTRLPLEDRPHEPVPDPSS